MRVLNDTWRVTANVYGTIMMVADAEDNRGKVWQDMAYKVTPILADGTLGKSKTFIGETAWMDAERYASDLQLKATYG